MTGASLLDLGEATSALPPSVRVTGEAGSARGALLPSPAVSLWLAGIDLEAGSGVGWVGSSGDEVVFAAAGEVRMADRRIGAGSAIVIEAAAAPELIAVARTRLLHFGADAPEPAGRAARPAPATHLVRASDARGPEPRPGCVKSRFYADSTCPTCRPTFLRNTFDGTYRGSSHAHTRDEIIVLIAGDLQIGRLELTPGMGVAIPAGERYAVRSHAGFDFVNFRSGPSDIVFAPGTRSVRESARMELPTHLPPPANQVRSTQGVQVDHDRRTHRCDL